MGSSRKPGRPPARRSKAAATKTHKKRTSTITGGAPVNEPAKPAPADDVVLVHSKTDDGEGVRVLRKKGEELSVGEVRPLKEGQPIYGDVVRLKAREEHPALYDVETEVAVEQTTPKRKSTGPSRVATDRYRSGWDSLWGRRKRRARKSN